MQLHEVFNCLCARFLFFPTNLLQRHQMSVLVSQNWNLPKLDFVQEFCQANDKLIIKAPHHRQHWSFWRETTGHGGFPAQSVSDAESVSMCRRHYVLQLTEKWTSVYFMIWSIRQLCHSLGICVWKKWIFDSFLKHSKNIDIKNQQCQ